ncbi:hypothetical protein Tco_1456996 [Tanacetum coccineum]
MTTLADKAILLGSDNRPPMLEKDMYNSCKSKMELYMMNRQHGRMILESIENGPLTWPTIEENGVTRPKKYSELSATKAIQADCDVKETNIILQGLPPEYKGGKFLLQRGQVGPTLQEKVEAILGNKGLLFVTTAKGKDTCPNNALNLKRNGMIPDDLDAYDSDCDELDTTKVSLVANLSHYVDVVNHSKTKITSDSNIIPYSQYMIESQQAIVQKSNSSAQQDALILSVIEQLKTQVVNCTKINLDNKSVNDTLTDELERYKEQVKVLKEGPNVDLKRNDTVLDPCAQYVEIDLLKQTLSEHLKEKESLMQTVTLLKNDFKKEESRNIDREIALEKRIKQLDNIVLKETNPTPSSRPTKVEVPKELPKVSMVNTSLRKLKHHLAGFDVVVKERTTATTITEGSWGFEHTKSCFRDEIIPFVVEQHRLESKTVEVKMNQVLNENERLLEQVISKDIVNIIVNSSVDNTYVNVHECEKCLKLETKLLNKTDFVEKEIYDKLFRSFTTLEKHCISLEVDTQLNP